MLSDYFFAEGEWMKLLRLFLLLLCLLTLSEVFAEDAELVSYTDLPVTPNDVVEEAVEAQSVNNIDAFTITDIQPPTVLSSVTVKGKTYPYVTVSTMQYYYDSSTSKYYGKNSGTWIEANPSFDLKRRIDDAYRSGGVIFSNQAGQSSTTLPPTAAAPAVPTHADNLKSQGFSEVADGSWVNSKTGETRWFYDNSGAQITDTTKLSEGSHYISQDADGAVTVKKGGTTQPPPTTISAGIANAMETEFGSQDEAHKKMLKATVSGNAITADGVRFTSDNNGDYVLAVTRANVKNIYSADKGKLLVTRTGEQETWHTDSGSVVVTGVSAEIKWTPEQQNFAESLATAGITSVNSQTYPKTFKKLTEGTEITEPEVIPLDPTLIRYPAFVTDKGAWTYQEDGNFLRSTNGITIVLKEDKDLNLESVKAIEQNRNNLANQAFIEQAYVEKKSGTTTTYTSYTRESRNADLVKSEYTTKETNDGLELTKDGVTFIYPKNSAKEEAKGNPYKDATGVIVDEKIYTYKKGGWFSKGKLVGKDGKELTPEEEQAVLEKIKKATEAVEDQQEDTQNSQSMAKYLAACGQASGIYALGNCEGISMFGVKTYILDWLPDMQAASSLFYSKEENYENSIEAAETVRPFTSQGIAEEMCKAKFDEKEQTVAIMRLPGTSEPVPVATISGTCGLPVKDFSTGDVARMYTLTGFVKNPKNILVGNKPLKFNIKLIGAEKEAYLFNEQQVLAEDGYLSIKAGDFAKYSMHLYDKVCIEFVEPPEFYFETDRVCNVLNCPASEDFTAYTEPPEINITVGVQDQGGAVSGEPQAVASAVNTDW